MQTIHMCTDELGLICRAWTVVISILQACFFLIGLISFEPQIESWTGSLELGVTCIDPDTTEELPSCARKLEQGTWVSRLAHINRDERYFTRTILNMYHGDGQSTTPQSVLPPFPQIMTSVNVVKDGSLLKELYVDVDNLEQGDRVGVLRAAQGELIFFINGESQGVAATDIPKPVWVVVNLYGKCSQVSISRPNYSHTATFSYLGAMATEVTHNLDIPMSVGVSVTAQPGNVFSNIGGPSFSELDSSGQSSLVISGAHFPDTKDRLHFHSRCGSLISLSSNSRTAERRRPLDEFNNGVVMTHRPLKDNELFEIRIDKLVDKWSGSIEVGVTTHSPNQLTFPATMTNLRSGTIMMSGCGILTNGKGTRREYGEFNLDELREGKCIAVL